MDVSSILDQLNDAQRQAVTGKPTNQLILARRYKASRNNKIRVTFNTSRKRRNISRFVIKIINS
jgi:hypothetical protein